MMSLPPSASNPGRTERAPGSHSPQTLQPGSARAACPSWNESEGRDLNSHPPALLVHRSAPSFVDLTKSNREVCFSDRFGALHTFIPWSEWGSPNSQPQTESDIILWRLWELKTSNIANIHMSYQ